jgi:hypothetical protein
MDLTTVAALMEELARARSKFPGNRYLLAALVEEVGELGEAMISGTKSEIYKEAIQCACVAVRIAEEGDATVYTPRFFIALVTAVGGVARRLLQRDDFQDHLGVLCEVASKMMTRHDPTFADITDEEAKP